MSSPTRPAQGTKIFDNTYPTPIAASASFPALSPGTTAPTAGIIISPDERWPTLFVAQFLSTVNNATGTSARLLHWSKGPSTAGDVWNVFVLAEFTLTYSTGTVASVTINGTLMYYFSGIVQVSGTVAANLYSPATAAETNTEPCAAVFDPYGPGILTFQVKGSAGSMMVCGHIV